MWPEELRWWLGLALQALLARAAYEMASPSQEGLANSRRAVSGPEVGPPRCTGAAPGCNLTALEKGGKLNPGPPGLPPQAREWSRRAIRRYAQAQDRKWRSWAEAVFEPGAEAK